MDTVQFLQTIFEYADAGHTQVFALPSTAAKSFPVDRPEMAPGIIAPILNQNIYFSPGICAEPKDGKLAAADIIGITALWADIDIYYPQAHKSPNLPQNVQEAMNLLPDELPPSIVVHSGYGLQAWWIFKESWYFDTPEEKQQAEQLLRNLQGYIRQRAQQNGWHLDSTTDLSRVMRLPGTWNHKIQGQPPVQAQVIETSEIRYNPSDIEDIIPSLAAPVASGTQRITSFERRPTDKPATLMLQNCNFLQHWHLNYKTLPEPIWMAAIDNILRGVDGEEIIIEATKNWLGDKYDHNKTMKKLDHLMSNCHPQTCEYIRSALGFQGCPEGGCDIKAPCNWSLERVPQARAILRAMPVLTPESANNPEVLGALAVLQKKAPLEYDQHYQKYQGNKSALTKALAKFKREDAGLTVVDGGQSTDPAPVADNNGERWLNQLVPDIPLNLKLPNSKSNYSSWRFGPNGVGLLRVSDKGESYSEAAYAPVIITERIYNIDSGTEKARVMFKTNRGGWRSVVLPKSTIFDAKKIMCLADAGLTVNSEMAKNLSKWLSNLEAVNAQVIPVRDGVSKMGWRNKDTEFILPGLDTKYTIDIGDSAAESAVSGLGVEGDFGTWIEAMRNLRTRPKARFIMAASFAAPLLKIVGQRTFLLHNWGTTADGKSATLFAALSVWGKPEEVAKTFDDTRTNIEKAAELFTDLPLGINEYELLNDRKKGEVDPLIYMIAEGKGRGRGKKDGSMQKTAQWRTIAIMTGESPITRSNSRGGVLTRLIELHGGPLADDKVFASSLYWTTARHYGHAGQWFIKQLLQANHAEMKEIYDKTRYSLRAKYPNKLESHMDAIACITLADYLASMWIFGANKETSIRESIAMSDIIIAELISSSEADDSERAWTWLQDWVAANEGRFTKSSYSTNKPVISSLGYIADGCVNIIKTELTNAMRLEGYSPEKIFRVWAERGRIPCSEFSGKRNYGIRGKVVNGVRPWVICVKFDD